MSYDDALRYLLALGKELAAPRQARVQKFDLRNISVVAEAIGHSERFAPCIHVAGTNGKGSTSAMLESILRAAGLRTGLFTSPHLERINERIQINGKPVSDDEFAASFERIRGVIEAQIALGALVAHPTFFECLTAMAFDIFAARQVQFAVFEVGMGGRLDATNIVTPEVAVITPIDFDHENYLGHSIEEIAGEKAGIVKQGACVVSAVERPEARGVIARRCEEQEAELVEVDAAWSVENVRAESGCFRADAIWQCDASRLHLEIPLPGRFQLRNALTAAAAANLLGDRSFRIGNEAIAHGISTVRWPGRLERISDRPAIFLDGAHNPSAARELRRFWDEELAGRRIILVYGAMRDKAVDEIAGILFPRAAHVILTEPHQSRAISVATLAQISGHFAVSSENIADSAQAIERAISIASPRDSIFVTGSLYLVGEARAHFATLRAIGKDFHGM